MDLTLPVVIGAAAFLIRGIAGGIYIGSILKGQTKPHLYTWLVFTILTAIAFLAQIQEDGGAGAWATGIATLACAINTILALLHFGEKTITKSDTLSLAASVIAIIPWVFTKDPLLSVVLASLINAVGMYPTLRKSFHKPYDEHLFSYGLVTISVALSLCALSHMSWTTILYPLVMALTNTSLILLCLWRRHVLKSLKP